MDIVSEGKYQGGSSDVLCKMHGTGSSRDEQDVRVVGQQPGETDLGGGDVQRGCRGDNGRVARHLWPGQEGRPEREERNPGQVVLATLVQERLVRPVEEVVEDLDASRCQRATPGMGTLAWQCPGDRTMNDLMLGAAGLEPTTSCSQSKLLRLSSLA